MPKEEETWLKQLAQGRMNRALSAGDLRGVSKVAKALENMERAYQKAREYGLKLFASIGG